VHCFIVRAVFVFSIFFARVIVYVVFVLRHLMYIYKVCEQALICLQRGNTAMNVYATVFVRMYNPI
jgi:hypothetical protein